MAEFESGIDFRRGDGPADVCLLLEGTYPYVSGGVSTWVNDLIRAQPHLRFHCVALLADRKARAFKYPIAENVLSLTHVYLQQPPAGPTHARGMRRLFRRLEPLMLSIQSRGGDRRSCGDSLDSRPPTRRAGRRDAPEFPRGMGHARAHV